VAAHLARRATWKVTWQALPEAQADLCEEPVVTTKNKCQAH
jgi:hypothetical protein